MLLDRGGDRYGFIHLTFQEYLAAVDVAQRGQSAIEPVVTVLADHLGDDTWREVGLLTVGYLGLVQGRDEAAGAVLLALLSASGAHSEPGEGAALAAEALLDAWPSGIAPQAALEIIERLRTRMLDDSQGSVAARARVARVLGRLLLDGRAADIRPGIGLDAQGLPDIDWVAVPAGAIALEEDGGTFKVAAFHLACYPVTVEQFRAFEVAQDGYQNTQWWDEARFADGPKRSSWPVSNHPRESVSWYEALAFCRWLSEQRGFEVRLPTEVEWQQAASGAEAHRVYPWGKAFSARLANTSESGLGRTSAVGIFPAGGTVHGIQDMAGNVFEWCANAPGSPDKPATGKSEDERALRGGAWDFGQDVARCANRISIRPYLRYDDVGFRVCCESPHL